MPTGNNKTKRYYIRNNQATKGHSVADKSTIVIVFGRAGGDGGKQKVAAWIAMLLGVIFSFTNSIENNLIYLSFLRIFM